MAGTTECQSWNKAPTLSRSIGRKGESESAILIGSKYLFKVGRPSGKSEMLIDVVWSRESTASYYVLGNDLT